MRLLIIGIIATIAFGSVLSSPARATDKDAFAKRVGKYATVDPSKPKGLCWCKDGFGPYPSPASGEAGYIIQQNYGGVVSVSCMIPEFNGDGSFLDYYACYVEWGTL